MMVEFQLRFPIEEIDYWSRRYQYPGVEIITDLVAPRVRQKGYLTGADLMQICEWKSPRNRSRCAANAPEFVQEATAVAFSTPSERLRIEALTLLTGVGWPTASVILHFCHTDRYPILDYRALWSLSRDVPARYNYEFWTEYAVACRALATEADVSMRTLDRALWQYSKEKQQ